ncbi:MAG: hypothetical protein KatS3mg076_3279 [Candidatus Binatia bacterium]|nr:MAG: hypothetical protein KatS3mg076_3279 [Candidatus Binatia bacterium]
MKQKAKGGKEPRFELVATLPGLEAEFAAQALTLEGIPCVLECGDLRTVRLPGGEPVEPFAVTLPVAIYVGREQAEEAREILSSVGKRVEESSAFYAPSVQAPAGPVDLAALAEQAAPRVEESRLQWALIVFGVAVLFFLLVT